MKRALLISHLSLVHEQFNQACIIALTDLNYEIHIMCNFEYGDEESINYNKIYKDKLEKSGIIIHQMNFKRNSFCKNLKYISKIKKIIKNYDFDIVHAHTETGGMLLRLAYVKNKKTKYIYTPHGMSFYNRSSLRTQLIYKPLEKYICNKMNQNIAVNFEEYKFLKKWNEKSANYIHGIGIKSDLIYNEIPNRNLLKSELNIPNNSFIIMSTGELNDNKHHDIVIKSLNNLKKENVYYIICGEGENLNKLQKLVDNYNLSSRVFLLGYRRDIYSLLKQVDLFILPSYHEGLSVALMEAMSSGVPVICSKIRGNVDLIEDNVNGYLFEVDNLSELTNKINDIINDNVKRNFFAENSLKKIQKFDIKIVTNEMKSIYEK